MTPRPTEPQIEEGGNGGFVVYGNDRRYAEPSQEEYQDILEILFGGDISGFYRMYDREDIVMPGVGSPQYNQMTEYLINTVGANEFYANMTGLHIPRSQINEYAARNRGRLPITTRVRGAVGRGIGNIGRMIRRGGRLLGDLFNRYRLFAGAPPKLPYKYFDDTPPEEGVNCIENYLVNKYAALKSKNTRVAESSIKRWMKKCKNEPTIQNLIEFCDKYKISLVLYLPNRRIIYKNDIKNSPRPNACGMIWNEHFYPYNPPLTKQGRPNMSAKINFEIDCTVPDFSDKKGKMCTKESAFDDKMFEFFNQLATTFPRTFGFECEANIYMKPLNYMSEDIMQHCGRKENDLKNAYGNMILNIADEELHIPVFDAFDMWNKYDNETIKCGSYYLVNSDKMKSHVITNAFGNNLMHGFIVTQLLEMKLITTEDIEYVKHPARAVKLKTFREKVAAIKIDGMTEEEKFKYINYSSGLTASCKYDNNVMTMKTKYENDVDMVQTTMKEDEMLQFYRNDECYHIEQKPEKPKIYMMTRRNIYNFIIDACKHEMLKFIHAKQGNRKIIKLTTDSVLFDTDVDSDGFPYFRQKYGGDGEGNYKYANYGFYPISGKNLSINVRRETKKVLANVIKLYVGAPGAGKTTKVMKEHDEYSHSSSITNVCCRNIIVEGKITKTCHSLFKLGSPNQFSQFEYKNKTFWFDEISMISRFMFTYIFILLKQNKVILSGDMYQTRPPCGLSIAHTYFYRKLVNDKEKYCPLTTDYRNDKLIINIRQKVEKYIDGHDIESELYDLIKPYRIHPDDDWWNRNVHVVATNNYRFYINQEVMKRRMQVFNYNKETNEYEVSKGLILVGKKKSKSLGIYKLARYEVIGDLKLRDLHDDSVLTLKSNSDYKLFKVGYAITSHSIQGLTIKEPFVIWQTKLMMWKQWDPRMFYVALTRARYLGQIIFGEHESGYDKNKNYAVVDNEEDEKDEMDEQIYLK